MTVAQLRDLREQLGLRQDVVARVVLGYAHAARLQNYERGARAMPDADRERLESYLVSMAAAHVATIAVLAA